MQPDGAGIVHAPARRECRARARLANSWRDRHYPNQKLDATSLIYTKAPQIIRVFDEGGTTPLIVTYLIARTADDLAPAYYLMAVTLVSFIALRGLPETARKPLR
jgi:hypothetical protein